MELRHLRYFIAVAEELHFRRAAERLYVAQPAVSEQIRKLEQELGVRLFERTPQVALTSAGEVLLIEARDVLRQADSAVAAARATRDEASLRLRVGYVTDALPTAVPRALADLAPRVHVELKGGPQHRLVEQLRGGQLDAVVTTLPAPTTQLRVTDLGHQGAIAALPSGRAPALRPAVGLEALAQQRLLVLPRDVDPAFRDALHALAHEAGVSLDLVEVAQPEVEHALLETAAGLGIAVLPESVAERYAPPGIRFVPIEHSEAAVRSAVLTGPATENLAVRAFLRAVTRRAGATAEDEPRAAAVA
jgi:DNA-binding transcriptional LysR family regulator